MKIHGLCSTGCHTARLALETCVNARHSRAHTNRCLRRVLRRLRTKSCPLLGIDKNNAKSRLVRADVLAVTVESQCARMYGGKYLLFVALFLKISKHVSYGRYRRLNCEKSDSVTCRRLQRVYARRCSLRCHDLRTKAADCPGSHVKCFLQFARHLQAQKCSIVGTGRRDLPQPPLTSSSGTRNPDDDDDDDEEDSGSFGGRAFGGSSSSSFQSSSSVSNVNSTSTNNGTLSARSASNSSAPGQDNTLFYVLIALMAALIFLVIVGIALMCIWWQPKSNSNYVEAEEDHKLSSSAF